VNQSWNPRKRETGSNLVDTGRAAARGRPWNGLTGSGAAVVAVLVVTGNACGVLVAGLPGNSWAPCSPAGSW
jgi:hypothetical protein